MRCGTCGAPPEAGVTPGTIFLNGEDVTGWGEVLGEGGHRIAVCPACHEAACATVD